MSEFIMVKAKETLSSLKYLEESYQNEGVKRNFYIRSEIDKIVIGNLEDKSYPLYILVFSEENSAKKVEYIYLGTGTKSFKDNNITLSVSIKQKMSNISIINNFIYCSEIDLDKDFDIASYITIEKSPSLVKQMNFIVYPPYKSLITLEERLQYNSLEEEKLLSPLAQRNEYCIKEYYFSSNRNNRGEFQRDYERIVHSRAFRRMVDKAQIFSAEKGDHYRTRMTHSLVVSQIAKGISNELKLNMFLTDAIALGHDIGHTPFGHQGERTINDILSGNHPLLKDTIKEDGFYGGFKHNYHSLRVATRLEEKYIEFEGLNLSFQTLDGIWKHTKTNLPENCISNFVQSDELRKYLFSNPFPCTLEGQVVRVADEIAQRSHDLEDAFSARQLSVEELKDYLLLGKMKELKTQIEEIETSFNDAKKSNHFAADYDELLRERISSSIIHFFINDVLNQSKSKIDKYISNDGETKFKNNGYMFTEIIIDFSPEGKRLCDYLEKIISKKVINSSEVSLFDSNGAAIIEYLFRAYYKNPRLLHKGTLNRIMQDFRKVTKNVISFEEGDPNIIEKEWKKIIQAKPDVEDIDLVENEYQEKNKILIRNIADFIAGMTDSYAIKEYSSIRK
ncbi:deoxyguanosinetriphosphate triphosphohydrolase family protein [Acetoanaerobium noterae]|uniref:deoxyguanosinetriphosphate triphosphohydrolase family protein n=1 Tax=Acetoanaerobium noterae TaxID=745369 RepID=UPI003342472A